MGTNPSHVTIVGRLGNPPKTQIVSGAKGEKVVTGISVAMDDDVRVGDEWKDNTQWYWVEGWNGLADRMSKLGKGDLVLVQGKLKQSTIEIAGQKVVRTKIWADSVRLLSSNTPKAQTEAAPAQASDGQEFADAAGFGHDDDVPF